MSLIASQIDEFIDRTDGAVLVRVAEAKGSTPREAGAFMLVSAGEMIGTIGGGQLEYLAIDAARRLLREEDAPSQLDVPLGPDIGQCCGGRVSVTLERMSGELHDALEHELDIRESGRTRVYIMGAGHVGRAIARALAPVPVTTQVIDTRSEALADLPGEFSGRLSVIPEADVRNAPKGSAFVILTHDHALDFLIAREALKRGDAAYVGMIGSKTKLASFRSWLRAEGEPDSLAARLVCPIGGTAVKDKRPEVIAALAVAEILVHTARREASSMTGVAAGKLGNG